MKHVWRVLSRRSVLSHRAINRWVGRVGLYQVVPNINRTILEDFVNKLAAVLSDVKT